MTLRTRHLSLASVFASLLLVYPWGETIASSRGAVQEAGLMRLVQASTEPLACDSDSGISTACLDVTSNGANITHIFIDTGCDASPSEYAITVDGEPIEKLYTNDGPCEDIPRDVWFPLHTNQDTAHVCVSVQGSGPGEMRVSAKAGNECIVGTPQ